MKQNSKTNLDEMQERRLFQIEEIGVSLTFWASGAADQLGLSGVRHCAERHLDEERPGPYFSD